jgi:hypothetical protein
MKKNLVRSFMSPSSDRPDLNQLRTSGRFEQVSAPSM